MSDKTERREGFRTETASGLPDSMSLEIGEAYFARDPKYNNGQTLCLIFKGKTSEVMVGGEVQDNYDLDENPLLYPCGDGWDSFDNGETAEHEKGRKGFTDRSAVGILIDTMIDELDAEDELAARGDSMTQAAIWKGLNLHLERKEFDYGLNRKTGESMKATRLMPTKLLGAATKAKAKKAKPEPAESAESAESESFDVDQVDAKLLARLKVAAKKADSEDAFTEAAIDIDGVAEDDVLLTAATDGSLYAALT
jgi:hypothetical protein